MHRSKGLFLLQPQIHPTDPKLLCDRQVIWWEAHSISVLEGTPEVIVTGSYDQTIQVWDWEGRRLQTMSGHLNSVTCLALFGEVLFSAGPDKSLMVIYYPCL